MEYANKELGKKHIPSTKPLFFQASGISLIVNGQQITSCPKEAMHFHINGTRLRQHLQSTQLMWVDNVWNTINFAGLGLAYKSLPVSKRLQINKLLHGWLPTGHKRNQVDEDTLAIAHVALK